MEDEKDARSKMGNMVKCPVCGKYYVRGSTCCRTTNQTFLLDDNEDSYR